MSPLPVWPAGTVCVLTTTGDDGPHAIPVSTAVRVSGERIVLALAPGRASLARLRRDPRVAFTVVTGPDVAFTARGEAAVAADPLPGTGVVAVAIAVVEVHRHERSTFSIDAGVAWRWTDDEARERDGEVRAALRRLPPA